MLQFDFHNCMADSIGSEHGLDEKALLLFEAKVQQAHEQLQTWRKDGTACFYDLPGEADFSKCILAAASELKEQFDNLVVLGIGGSALGTRCLANALLPQHYNLLSQQERGGPRLFICDNIDPVAFDSLLKVIDIKKTCFNVISKSGQTTETAAQFYLILNQLKKSVGANWKEHFVFTTDPAQGELRDFAKREAIKTFSIPSQLGGRFSVLSPVGMFPAACVGIDIEEVLAGAADAAKSFEQASFADNPAYQFAALNYLLATTKNKSSAVLFSYVDALQLFVDWYIQLWAESLGKSGHGTTPLKAIGSTDQHSQLQLFMEGPADKLFTFLSVEEYRAEPADTLLEDIPTNFSHLAGKSFGEILQACQLGTASALTKVQRPNLTITLPEVNAASLGQLFMFYQIATAISGVFYGVNPFDQPGVELSKQLTKQILQES